MRELKPKLIIANSGRRRKGPGSGFWSFLTLLIVFLVGVYVGTKIDGLGLIGGGLQNNKKKITSARNPVKYEVKNTESLVHKYIIPSNEKGTGGGEDDLSTREKLMTHEMTSPAPVLSVSENKANSGITSIDPGRMTGMSSEVGNTVTAEPAIKPDDTINRITNTETTKGKYTLQVGAFADKVDAEKAVNEYRIKGFNAYTVQAENSRGEKWNLVKVGKYGSIEEAWSQADLFKRTEGKDAYIEVLGKKTVFNESWGKNEKNSN